MQYVQGGAEFIGKPTKGGLKEAIKENPRAVLLYGTSQMGPQFNDYANNLPPDITFNVVGPDPYTKRDWYTSVYVARDGSVKVK